MARNQKLEVYRTPIGFHDAYVAAASQKAALNAWGADVDLVARGLAERVDDGTLMQAPLEKPGTVVRVVRGSSAEHMAALPKDKPTLRKAPPPSEDDGPPPRRRSKSGTRRSSRRTMEEKREPDKVETAEPARDLAPTPTPKAPPKPRPSRAQLDKAEKALELAESGHKDAIAGIRKQKRALQQKRRDLEKRHEDKIAQLEAAIAKAREGYSAALESWRA